MDNNKTNGQPVGLFADKALKDEPHVGYVKAAPTASTQTHAT